MGYAKYNFNHLPEFLELLARNVAAATINTGQAVERNAKELVPSIENPGPFATSALKTAIHLSTPYHSGYAEATSAARHVRDSAPNSITYGGKPRNEDPLDKYITPDEPIEREPGEFKVRVLAPLDYAYFVELGGFSVSVLSDRAPGPFMAPAGEAEIKNHESRLVSAILNAASVMETHAEGRQIEMYFAAELAKSKAEANKMKREMQERLRNTNAYARHNRRTRRDASGNLLSFGELAERMRRDAQDELDRNASGGGA